MVGIVVGFAIKTPAKMGPIFLGNDSRLQWETLLTGFAAVAVAAVTVTKLNEQIRQTKKLETDKRERQAKAVRAMLPLALAEIAGYATECMRKFCELQVYFYADDQMSKPRKNLFSSIQVDCASYTGDCTVVAKRIDRIYRRSAS